MILKNASRYPTAEIRRLLAFAADGFDLRRVAVHVKNSQHAYRGMAYERVPRIANAAASATRLVTVGIGDPEKFPADNMRVTKRWVVDHAGVRRLVVERHPYGGKGSPLIELGDWREAVVAVAAHEFTHIHQYQNNLPRSEVHAERAAAKRLAAYRAATGGGR